MNPHTHQLKLCDFGSAKVLVSFCPTLNCKSIGKFLSNINNQLYCVIVHAFDLSHRWKENPMFPIYVLDITVLPNSYLVPLNIQRQLIYGQLVVLWLNYFLGRLYNASKHFECSDFWAFVDNCYVSLWSLICSLCFPEKVELINLLK